MLDAHGQPDPGFNAPRRIDRGITEMFGLTKGLLADGTVAEGEARLLWDWIAANQDVAQCWPGNELTRRLKAVFADGHVSAEELDDLREIMRRAVGGIAGIHDTKNTSTALPFNDPQPPLEITDRVFVLTGRFACGCRSECEERVKRAGGWVEKNVTARTDILVVGYYGSRDWIQTAHGRKIEKAVRYREKHGRPWIISEEHWATHV